MLNLLKNRLVIVLLFGVFWTKAASLLSMPFLTLYLHENTNLSIVAIGFIVGCQPFALCFGSTVGGYLSDIYKREVILFCSVVLSAFVYLGFYLVSKFLHDNSLIIGFAILNLANGFGAALFSPVARAILSNIAKTPEENVQYLHARYFVINLGAAIGPILGAYLGVAGNSSAFMVTSLSYVLYGALLFTILKQHKSISSNNKSIEEVPQTYSFTEGMSILIKNKVFVALVVSLTLFNVLYVQLWSNFGLIITENIVNGTVFFSFILSLSAILVIILQPILFVFIKKKSQQQVMLYGYLVLALSFILIWLLPMSKVLLIIFVTGFTIAEIMIFPPSSILVSDFVEKKYLGIAYGVFDLEYFGSAIGPAIGGALLQHFSLNSYWIFLLLINILCIVIFMPCLKSAKVR